LWLCPAEGFSCGERSIHKTANSPFALIATSGAAAIWLFCDKIIGSAELAEVARASAMNIARLMTDLRRSFMASTFLSDRSPSMPMSGKKSKRGALWKSGPGKLEHRDIRGRKSFGEVWINA
jgi:hypothetical protein